MNSTLGLFTVPPGHEAWGENFVFTMVRCRKCGRQKIRMQSKTDGFERLVTEWVTGPWVTL